MKRLLNTLRWLWKAERFSPAYFIGHALLICIAFAIIHSLGWRVYTSILNGTIGSDGASWQQSAAYGLTYLLLYMAFVLLVPILLITSLLIALWTKWTSHEP